MRDNTPVEAMSKMLKNPIPSRLSPPVRRQIQLFSPDVKRRQSKTPLGLAGKPGYIQHQRRIATRGDGACRCILEHLIAEPANQTYHDRFRKSKSQTLIVLPAE